MGCFQNNNLFIWSWSMVIGISGEILPLVVVWFCYVGTEYFWNMLFMVLRIHIDSKKLADFGTKYENVYIINEHSYECVTKMSCSWQVKMFHHFILHSSKLISYYLYNRIVGKILLKNNMSIQIIYFLFIRSAVGCWFYIQHCNDSSRT